MMTERHDPSEAAEQTGFTPEEYNLLLARLTPRSVRLENIACRVNDEPAIGALESRAEMHVPVIVSIAEGPDGDGSVLADIRQSASFSVANADGRIVVSAAMSFRVLVKVDLRPPEEFWDIFLSRNVKLYTHPPLRDLAASLCARANVVAPPLPSVSVLQRVTDKGPRQQPAL